MESKTLNIRDTLINHYSPGVLLATGTLPNSQNNLDFSGIYNYQKLYKYKIFYNVSNLRIAGMIPGNRNGLPDDFHFLFLENCLRGIL